MLEELCGIPVVGVVPYYRDIYIEEEDSVALAAKSVRAEKGKVNIAVILLRHLSNFTDFNVLERDPRVHLFYTNNVDELAKADVILLPGSKSTLGDLYELRRNGVTCESIVEVWKAYQNALEGSGENILNEIPFQRMDSPVKIFGLSQYIVGIIGGQGKYTDAVFSQNT